jgi:hypothetical protein
MSLILAPACNGAPAETLTDRPAVGAASPEITPAKLTAIQVNDTFEAERGQFLAAASQQGDLDAEMLDIMRDAHEKHLEAGMGEAARLIEDTYDLDTGKLRAEAR